MDERPIDQTKYKTAIINGFRACGLYPVNVDEVLPRLPQPKSYESVSQAMVQLLDKLHGRRYNPGPNKPAPRPSLKTRLPPGATYTCLSSEVRTYRTVPTYLPTYRYGTYLGTGSRYLAR